jgi:deoxyribodipyrimidine photolyase
MKVFYVSIIVTVFIMTSRSVVGLTNSASSKGNSIYYWFRLGDMRLHDNPALDRAADLCIKTESNLVPVFCFDPRLFGDSARSEFGSMKCGPRRAKFVIESVADLRKSLEENGSKLLVSTKKPETFFSEILSDAQSKDSNKLIYQEEVCSEEQNVAKAVEKLFQSSEAVWGSTVSYKTLVCEFHFIPRHVIRKSKYFLFPLLRCTI